MITTYKVFIVPLVFVFALLLLNTNVRSTYAKKLEDLSNFSKLDTSTKNTIQQYPLEVQKKLVTQATEMNDVFNILDKVFGSYEAFSDKGTIYLSNSGEIIIGLTGISDEKLNTLKASLQVIDEDNLIKFESVKYSINELEQIQDEVALAVQRLIEDKSVITDLDLIDKKITVSVEDLKTDEEQKILSYLNQNNYIDLIQLKSHDQSMNPYGELARARNWTKLGGGIQIRNAYDHLCTTAGIGKKGTNYFVLTAAHCLDSNNTYVKQDTATLGVVHSRGHYSNIDVGLIRVTTASTITRYATNYFYELAENKDDYDRRVTGSSTPIQGQFVCKSGITTGVTCGNISTLKTTYMDPNGLAPGTRNVARITPLSGVDYSQTGDSGAITYDPSTYRVVGIHSGGGGLTGLMTRINDVISLYSDSTNTFSIYSSSTDALLVSK